MANLTLIEEWCVVPAVEFTCSMEQEENYIKPNGTLKHVLKEEPKKDVTNGIIETEFENDFINKWILKTDQTKFPRFVEDTLVTLKTNFGKQILKVRSGDIFISKQGRKTLEKHGFKF